MVEAPALVADLALDECIREAADVAARDPHLWVGDERRIDADHVVAVAHHRPPPGVADVALEFDAERAVIVGVSETAIDLGGGEDKPAALGEGNDRFEVGGWHVSGWSFGLGSARLAGVPACLG